MRENSWFMLALMMLNGFWRTNPNGYNKSPLVLFLCGAITSF